MALAALNTKSAADRGVKIDILHPATWLPLGIRFTVLGTDSAAYKGVVRRQQERNLEMAKKQRGRLQLTAEMQEADALEILVTCTTGWERDVADDQGKVTGVDSTIESNEGEFLEFTPENVRRIYADPGYAWLREQIDREIGDRRNFLPS